MRGFGFTASYTRSSSAPPTTAASSRACPHTYNLTALRTTPRASPSAWLQTSPRARKARPRVRNGIGAAAIFGTDYKQVDVSLPRRPEPLPGWKTDNVDELRTSTTSPRASSAPTSSSRTRRSRLRPGPHLRSACASSTDQRISSGPSLDLLALLLGALLAGGRPFALGYSATAHFEATPRCCTAHRSPSSPMPACLTERVTCWTRRCRRLFQGTVEQLYTGCPLGRGAGVVWRWRYLRSGATSPPTASCVGTRPNGVVGEYRNPSNHANGNNA